MPWMSIVAPIASGFLQGGSSSGAASEQSDAALKAEEGINRRYDQTREDSLPWLTRGNAAGDRRSYLLGLSPYGGGGAGSNLAALSRGQLRDQLVGQFTKTTETPYELDLNTRMWLDSQVGGWQNPGILPPLPQNKTTSTTIDEVGLNAAIDAKLREQEAARSNALAAAASDPEFGSLMRDFSISDFQKDPGYQFRMDEGSKALDRSAASRGGLFSGATLKALSRFNQDFASNEFGKAWDRDAANKARKNNFLASMEGSGQSTASTLGSQGLSSAALAGQAAMAGGEARAGGIVGVGNAVNRGLSSMVNNWNAKPQTSTHGVFDHGLYDPTYGAGMSHTLSGGGWGME